MSGLVAPAMSLVPAVRDGLGQAADLLSIMLGSPVRIASPAEVEILSPEGTRALFADPERAAASAVEMSFLGDMEGTAQLIFLGPGSSGLVECAMREFGLAGEDADSIREGALCEVGNIVINAIVGTISNFFGMRLRYEVPIYLTGGPDELLYAAMRKRTSAVILVRSRFLVDDALSDCDIALFMALDSMERLERAAASLERA